MIKLIASDLDGTLLPEGTKDINPEFYDVVRALNEEGVIFVAASGREMETMQVVLDPVADIIYGICNNGARIVKGFKENLTMLTLEWELVKEIIEEVRQDDKFVFVAVNTPEGTYTDTDNQEMIDWLVSGYGMSPIRVDDVLCKPLDVMKISLFVKGDAGVASVKYNKLFGDRAHVTAAGDHWVDFTHPDADKGVAFKKLLEMLDIKPEETMAFGDNNNDISMIEAAGIGVSAPGARPEVKRAANICLEGSLWDAVINHMKLHVNRWN